MIVNRENVQNLVRGLRVNYDESYQATAAVWDRVATRMESGGAEEEYDFLLAIPGMRELVGEVQLKNLVAAGFTIKNREWESTIDIKRRDIERDRLGLYKPLSQDMGRVAKQHPDELLGELMVNGFDATKGRCYTGLSFFNAAHIPPGTDAAKSTFGNKMTAKLSVQGFRDARTALRSRKNSEGRSLKLGSSLLLIVHPKNEGPANDILKADHILQSKGSSFAAVSNVDKGAAEIQLLPELGNFGGDDMWFLLDTARFMRPFIVQMEKEPEVVSVTDPEDSYVVKNKAFLFATYARYNVGYAMPEFVQGSDGTTAAL